MVQRYISKKNLLLNILSLTANCASLHLLLVLGSFRNLSLRYFGVFVILTALVELLVNVIAVTKLYKMAFVTVILLPLIMGIMTLRAGGAPQTVLGWITVVSIWSAPGIRSCMFTDSPPTPEKRESDFDFVVITLLIAAAMSVSQMYDITIVIPQLIGMMASLLCMGILRASGHGSQKGKREVFWMMLLPVSLMGIVLAFVRFAASPFAEGLEAVEQIMWNGLLRIGLLVQQLLEWIASLLPATDTKINLTMENAAYVAEASEEGVQGLEKLFTIFLIGFLIVLAIFVWLYIQRKRKPVKIRQAQQKMGVSISVLDIIRKIIRNVLMKLRMRVWYMKKRNTPAGLFVYLERKYRRAGKVRQKGESSRAFLERIAEETEAAEKKETFTRLADMLDEQLYSRQALTVSAGEIRQMKKTIIISFNSKEKSL